MVIEIRLPKYFRRFLYAWASFKLAWKLYEKRTFQKALDGAEAQKLFEELYTKHMATAKEIMKGPKKTFVKSESMFAGKYGSASEVNTR